MSALDQEITKALIENHNAVRKITFHNAADISEHLFSVGEERFIPEILRQIAYGKCFTEARLIAIRKSSKIGSVA